MQCQKRDRSISRSLTKARTLFDKLILASSNLVLILVKTKAVYAEIQRFYTLSKSALLSISFDDTLKPNFEN